MRDTSVETRVLGICAIFFGLHGQFQVPSTYGRLNERWILPDWLDDIPEQR